MSFEDWAVVIYTVHSGSSLSWNNRFHPTNIGPVYVGGGGGGGDEGDISRQILAGDQINLEWFIEQLRLKLILPAV